MIMQISAKTISIMPRTTWLSAMPKGAGHPSIMTPIEKYMSIARKISEKMTRFFNTGVSLSLRVSSAETLFELPKTEAP